MNEDRFIRNADGTIVLYLLRTDMDTLKQAEEFPYWLRRGQGELDPYTLPDWHPRRHKLGERYSTLGAQERYLTDMRGSPGFPDIPRERRVHLHILPKQAAEIGARFDRFAEMFYVPDDHPDAAELRSALIGGEHEANWKAWRQALHDRRKGVMWNVANSGAHNFGKILGPKRGPKPGQDPWWPRMAWSYFKDLAAIGAIHSASTQAEVFRLIVTELAVWQIRVTADALRHIDGSDWKDEIEKLGPPTIEICQ